jgi:hypothetical protein
MAARMQLRASLGVPGACAPQPRLRAAPRRTALRHATVVTGPRARGLRLAARHSDVEFWGAQYQNEELHTEIGRLKLALELAAAKVRRPTRQQEGVVA